MCGACETQDEPTDPFEILQQSDAKATLSRKLGTW
jgi:hypothetical protein